MAATLLIVDDEKHTRDGLQAAFEEDFDVYLAPDADTALRLLDEEPFDAVLTDLRMAGRNGMKVVDHAVKLQPRPVVMMMTAYGTVDTAVEAMKRGADDFVTKPLNLEKLDLLLKRALKNRKLEKENHHLHQRLDQKFSFPGIVGHSAALQQVLDQLRQVAPSKATIMVYGETGTGKELVAQLVHQNSPRARGPFIAVHCAALPANLLESELFGHEKGAFTGAAEKRVGRFEMADHGTLFLDEIGEIDAPTQVKLLRFLETRQVERVGTAKPIPVDVRLVCATHRDLRAMVAAGTFREDLFFRLSVVPVTLPPLRDRREDIPVLLNHFLAKAAEDNAMPQPELAPDAVAVLTAYPWPGNIRELRNLAENLVVTRRGGTVTRYDLEPRFELRSLAHGHPAPGSRALPDLGAPVAQSAALAEHSPDHDGASRGNDPEPAESASRPPVNQRAAIPFGTANLSRLDNEKRLLRQALQQAQGNRTRAAELLGISRRTLHRKLAQWPELDPLP